MVELKKSIAIPLIELVCKFAVEKKLPVMFPSNCVAVIVAPPVTFLLLRLTFVKAGNEAHEAVLPPVDKIKPCI
jgi:hypothetical protein